MTNANERRLSIEKFVYENIGDEVENNRKIIYNIWLQFQRRWNHAQRKKERFLAENEKWLLEDICFKIIAPLNAGGRPVKDFPESSERTKRRKTEILRKSHSSGKFMVPLFYKTMKVIEIFN